MIWLVTILLALGYVNLYLKVKTLEEEIKKNKAETQKVIRNG